MPNFPKTVNSDRPEESPSSPIVTNNDSNNRERQQPIPPPSNPRQYRAIGLVRGKYQLSGEQLTQGTLTTTDGTEIEAVLLGRTISLVKNHLDLDKEHLWVVYPRTRQIDEKLHVQIVGVWEPETLHRSKDEESEIEGEETIQSEARDGYFSIRGEVVFYSTEEKSIVIKIKQAPKKEGDKTKFFKLKLKGILSERPLRRFWELHVRLEGENLIIEDSKDMGAIPVKKRPEDKFARGKKPFPSRRLGEERAAFSDRPTPVSRPTIKERPITKTEKPTPRPKPTQN